jgi:metallo-beta-lactamase class B
MKRYLPVLFLTLPIWAGLNAVDARAQAKGSAEAHVAAAKAAAYKPGQDFTWVFDQNCKQPEPPRPAAATPAAQATPAQPAAPRVPPKSEWFQEPSKVFDNLYYVGSQLQSMWVVKTSEGLILHDTAFDYMVQDQVVGGLKKLGLDPADIKYIIISHGHNDHYLGARYLQDTYKAHVLASKTDWDFMEKDNTPADKKPRRDMVVEDGSKLTLGDTTLTMYVTPGHTPGTISTLIPVRDGNQKHLASIWGGSGLSARGFSSLEEAERLYSASAKRFRDIVQKAGADVYLSSHTVHDKTLDKLNALRFRNPGDPNPFVSKDAVSRQLTIVGECADAQLAWAAKQSN